MPPNFSRWDTANFPQLVESILEGIFVIASVLAFLGIIYGGFKYLTAGPSETETAKKSILHSIIGLVLAALSLGIIVFIIRFISG